jgi:HlyD family secretion protein
MLRRLILFLILAAAALAGIRYLTDFSANTAEPAYRLAKVDRGSIVATVNSTGTINPITTVIVSSQLSGQVVEILADYNSQVKAEQVVARLNSDQIRAKLDGARADLEASRAQRLVTQAQIERAGSEIVRAKATEADANAQIARAEALLADAERLFSRQSELQSRGYATQAALDTARAQRDAQRAALAQAQAALANAKAQQETLAADQRVARAQLQAVVAQIAQREAVVRQIEVDLKNTEIRSPVDGVVIQRNIELGQTVAASLQAPTLFLIADDLHQMEISGNVDEADVGRVLEGQRVTFTVNAFPGRTFEGRVKQVRLGSQTVQNVVIYTTIVSVENPRLELKPGMTANLRIETERRDNALRVPNAALRWRPPSATPDTPTPGPGVEPAPAQRQQGQVQRATQEFVAALRNELDLSADQRAKLDAILTERRGRAGALLAETDPVKRRELFERSRREFAEQVGAILDPAQRDKFREIAQRFAPAEGRQSLTGRVYVLGTDGKPQPVSIRIGATDGGMTEVVSGPLETGREVIIGGGPKTPDAPRATFPRLF